MSTARGTALGAIGKGLLAGVAGTAAMTAWQELAAKLQPPSEGEGAEPDRSTQGPWEVAPAPARVAKLIGERVFHLEVPAEEIGFLTNAMHWGTGTGWGAAYGLLAANRGRSNLGDGFAFGTLVWGASYAQLVPLGIYEPPWKYSRRVLAFDISYHLVYGGATALAFAVLSDR